MKKKSDDMSENFSSNTTITKRIVLVKRDHELHCGDEYSRVFVAGEEIDLSEVPARFHEALLTEGVI